MNWRSVEEVLRVTLARQRTTLVVCSMMTAVLGASIALSLPTVWRVDVELYVTEPTLIHRLANPFAAVPSQREGLAELPERVTSRERLVAYVKRTGLLDQWESSRPWPQHLKDRVMTALRGPVSEKDTLDALVAMLDKRLDVSVEGSRIHIGVEWPNRRVAHGLAQAVMTSVLEQRDSREGRVLNEAATALDEQLAGVEAEIKTRSERIDAELVRAAVEHRRPAVDADREQRARDQSRAAELMVRAEEKHIAAEVMRRANALRFVVVQPPVLPRQPLGASAPVLFVVWVLVSLISGVVAALALALFSGRVVSGAQLTRAVGLEVLAAARVGWSGVTEPARKRSVALVVLLALATGVSLGVSHGNVAVALAPLLGAAALYALFTLPIKWPLVALLLVAVTVDDPTDRPYFNVWRSPLWGVGRIFYTNIAWFTGFELCVMGLVALMVLRRILQSGRRALSLDPLAGQAPRSLRLALVVSGLTVAWLIVLGVGRGGVFRDALWQFRALLMMPIVATLSLYALDFPRDIGLLARVLAFGSVVKSLLGMYFIYAVATPSGIDPPHTTGHNDTMIFVTATIVCLLLVWEYPTWRQVFRSVAWFFFVAMAMRLNDRRIAYVDIALVLGFVFALSPWHRMKRFATKLAVMMVPVLALYVLAGWNTRSGSFFKPVQKVRSIVSPAADTEEESSNVERDIENFNILRSWERNMFIGQGFGHAFTEVVPSNDFSQSNFGRIGHNSILWLWWIGGLVGFTGITLYLAVAVYAVGRTLRRTRHKTERAALLVALGIILTYLSQAFGDMGMLSMQFVFFVSVAVAIAGRLATKHGVMNEVEAPAAKAS